MNAFKENGLVASEKGMKENGYSTPSKEKNVSLPSGLMSTMLVCNEEMKSLEDKIINFFVQQKNKRSFVVIETQISSFCKSPPKIRKALENLEKQWLIMKKNNGWSLK